jgi:hypothetical protein
MTALEALLRGTEYAIGVALMFLCACLVMLAGAGAILIALVWSCIVKAAWNERAARRPK